MCKKCAPCQPGYVHKRCVASCKEAEGAWDDKCRQPDCGDCAPCHKKVCAATCRTGPGTWDEKCQQADCGGCARCDGPPQCVSTCRAAPGGWGDKCKLLTCNDCAPCHKPGTGKAPLAVPAPAPAPALRVQCISTCKAALGDWADKCQRPSCGGCAPCQKRCLASCKAAPGTWDEKCRQVDCGDCARCTGPPQCIATCKTAPGTWGGKCKLLTCNDCAPCHKALPPPADSWDDMKPTCKASCKERADSGSSAWDQLCTGLRASDCARCVPCQKRGAAGKGTAAAAAAPSGKGNESQRESCTSWCMSGVSKLSWPQKCVRVPLCKKCGMCNLKATPQCQGWCQRSELSWAVKCANKLCKTCAPCSSKSGKAPNGVFHPAPMEGAPLHTTYAEMKRTR